eukprot:scaffold435_cov342-Pavlova_lutheri.AAC.14
MPWCGPHLQQPRHAEAGHHLHRRRRRWNTRLPSSWVRFPFSLIHSQMDRVDLRVSLVERSEEKGIEDLRRDFINVGLTV